MITEQMICKSDAPMNRRLIVANPVAKSPFEKGFKRKRVFSIAENPRAAESR